MQRFEPVNYAKENNFDVMVILDGDGQHDPSFIPEFINQTLGKFIHQTFKKGLIQTLFFQTF